MGFNSHTNLLSVFITLCSFYSDVGAAIDTITSPQFIKDPKTLSSNDGNFILGFFSPENSTNRYVGIWWKPQFTVTWVANRNQPLKDTSGIVTISKDGNIVVMDGQKHVIWSSNVSNIASNSSFQLLDSGNLVLQEIPSRNTIWQSFQHPSDTLLPTMRITSSKRTDSKVKVTSWNSPSNPSIGSFSVSVERLSLPELFVWNETRPYWRSGPWNGRVFIGVATMESVYLHALHVVDDEQGNIDFYFTDGDQYGFVIYMLNWDGNIKEKLWNNKEKKWDVIWNSRQSDCDVYGICGAFASCSRHSSPICSCLRGFVPRNVQEWSRQNWTSGCVRRTPLQCERSNNQNSSEDSKEDGFLTLQNIKVPDFTEESYVTLTPDTCRSQCLANCSCIAFAYDPGIGCMSWTGNLIDIQQFSSGGVDLHVRVAYTDLGKHDKELNRTVIIVITITVTTGTLIMITCLYFMCIRTSKHPATKKKSKGFQLFNQGKRSEGYTSDDTVKELSQVQLQELLQLNFEKLATATNNFHSSNRLGQGGFGPVYKGKLEDGQEIAVKRLSRASGQGVEEFMNEVVVISKLQHRNLVRLLGCCIERDEKMLIYEYMPNKSLDAFIFDPSKYNLLDWTKRFSIIEGIARGLLYLHRDSRLRIIHRDLKASNILLDEELNPKVSDFGIARIFRGREDQANTKRVVGTYGYMSPEYAMQGLFSEKSDVFSFGVLLLEIVSGKRNSSFYDDEDSLSLLGFAWKQWRQDNIQALIDPNIYDPDFHKYILRCIHIGLLCVQELAVDRPTMAAVISMLNSEITNLPCPRQPGFILLQNMLTSVSSQESSGLHSINTVSITEIDGR